MNPYEININRLDSLGIYELRTLGRMVGVPRPTSLRRDDLIAGIKANIELGDFKKGHARGRKPRELKVDFSRLTDKEGINSHFNSILSQSLDPQVRDSASGEIRAVSGFVHLLPSGTAVLVSVDLNGYLILPKTIRAHFLKTGDFIEGKAIYNADRSSYIVEEISKKCNDDRFDDLEGIRPTEPSTTDSLFLLGERVLFVTPKPFDRLEEICKTADTINGAHKIALLIDETDDAEAFVKTNVQDVCLSKVNFSIQKQTIACLLALFRAKEAAEQGKKVVLFIDSLNKLFKIYNNSAYPDGRIDPSQINLAPLVDLKTFFLSARALKNGGSLSVSAFVNVPGNTTEDYIYNEFADLAQRIVRL